MKEYSIYPKDFKSIKQRYNEKKCFIIMPFSNDKNGAYETIKRAIEACGLKYDRSDELRKSLPFINKIISSIASAYYLIVDISGHNANVFYELGIAHTLRDADKVLILKNKETKCPSDLAHINYFEYDDGDYLTLYDHVVNFLKDNHYINDLKELLLLLDIISDNTESNTALAILESEMSTRCFVIINILNNLVDADDKKEICATFTDLYKLIAVYASQQNYVYSIYVKLLCFLLKKTVKEYDLSDFVKVVYSNPVIDEDEHIKVDIMVDLAVELVKSEIYYAELYDWIKLFLRNSSPASLNLSRYKLNIGIIGTKSAKMSEFLINLLETAQNDTLSEHALNLCKVKNIQPAVPLALSILTATENAYVFRSAIDLVTDIGSTAQMIKMFKIFTEKADFISNNQFIIEHINRAKKKMEK